ncbi:hypothetical protein M0R72_00890 [Candidatus Pacearchaeota archaeon]|jgi:hypothetical protein|nr:hypothetical protein [Candidatus Pacearchaeota archaeon]
MVTIKVYRYHIEPLNWFCRLLPRWKWLERWTCEEVVDELEVEAQGVFYKGEQMSFDGPGEPGYVEFEAAYLDGKPFILTKDEVFIAEEKILKVIRDETPKNLRKRWAI